jgi:bifunctional non-homologous end joining protein LigD
MEATPVKPMEPVLAHEIDESPERLYQVKWDGVRLLACKNGKQVRLFNRKGREKTATYPELVSVVKTLPVQSVVLDGEVIAIREGKPDFFYVMKRDSVSHAGKILATSIPVHYMVFDLLFMDGHWLLNEPLMQRIDRLSPLFTDRTSDTMQLCDSVEDGYALWEVTRKKGWEGIVSKEKNGLYYVGRKHPTWQKIKHFRNLTARVAGVTFRGKWVNALLLAVEDAGQWIYIGRAGSGLNDRERELITRWVPQVRQTKPSVMNPPSLKGVTWVEPILPVKVQYLEWTPDATLRSPSIRGFELP